MFTGVIPVRKTKHSAGFDFVLQDDVVIGPNELGKLIRLGSFLTDEFPRDAFLMLAIRSGIALKMPLRLSNSVGIIDADYRDEICVLVDNLRDEEVVLSKGDRICQGVIIKYGSLGEEPATERTGGFGSTGI